MLLTKHTRKRSRLPQLKISVCNVCSLLISTACATWCAVCCLRQRAARSGIFCMSCTYLCPSHATSSREYTLLPSSSRQAAMQLYTHCYENYAQATSPLMQVNYNLYPSHLVLQLLNALSNSGCTELCSAGFRIYSTQLGTC